MLGEIRGEVRFKEPLSFHTSLRIGGAADIFVVPQDVDDIRHALMYAEREQLPVAVVGGGNNLLVRDRGIRGVVLKLEGCLGRAEFHGEEAIAGAGVSLSALIREAERNGKAWAIMPIDSGLYQVVVVPVLAPDPIAWVAMGFSVDQSFLDDLSALTSLHVSFLTREADGGWKIRATTQPRGSGPPAPSWWPR